MGFGANASKDFLQSRGGEDDQSRALRDRKFSKTIIGKSLSLAGWDQEEIEDFIGTDADRYLGQYLEGIIALGGLGLLAEFFFNAAAQADNQHYGANRAMSAVLGPTFGAATDAFLSLKGGSELLTETLTGEDDGSNAEERIFARTLLRRVPVVGGFRPFSEGGADLIGGEIGGSGSSTSVDKFGKYTPGSNIPISSEEDIKSSHPDYMLILPWHFRENIIEREKEYLIKGGKLIFPLPEIEIVG